MPSLLASLLPTPQFEHLVVSEEMLGEARRFERELGEQLQGKLQEQAHST